MCSQLLHSSYKVSSFQKKKKTLALMKSEQVWCYKNHFSLHPAPLNRGATYMRVNTVPFLCCDAFGMVSWEQIMFTGSIRAEPDCSSGLNSQYLAENAIPNTET